MSYIGQRDRSGHVRMYECGQARENSDKNFILFQHFEITGHTFDLKNLTILDTEICQITR